LRLLSVRSFQAPWIDVNGESLEGPEVLAPSCFAFHGTALAENRQCADQHGLRLWGVGTTPRLSVGTEGLKPNGDIVQPVRITVFACGPARHGLTLLGRQGTPLAILLDRTVVMRAAPAPETVWRGAVASPSTPDGDGVCRYKIRSPGLVGSTRIEFVRTATSEPSR
jgi:hypothetical protein